MHQNIDYTDEDKLKEIMQTMIENPDHFIEKYHEIIDPEISFNYFKVLLGEIVEVTGSKQYFEFLKSVVSVSTIELLDLIASGKGDRFVLLYRQFFQKDAPLFREDVTWHYWMSIVYVRNGMMYKIRNCSNTLKLMQEYGIVTFRTEDKDRIYAYLQTLVVAGLIEEKFIKMAN